MVTKSFCFSFLVCFYCLQSQLLSCLYMGPSATRFCLPQLCSSPDFYNLFSSSTMPGSHFHYTIVSLVYCVSTGCFSNPSLHSLLNTYSFLSKVILLLFLIKYFLPINAHYYSIWLSVWLTLTQVITTRAEPAYKFGKHSLKICSK